MQPNNVFGLVGRSETGKDTFYLCCLELFLEGKIKVTPKRFSFADKIKEEVAKKLGLDGAYEVEKKKSDPKVRAAVRDHAMMKREIDKYYWIKFLKEEIQANPIKHPHFKLFTDVRFLSDAEYVKSLGGILIRIRRRVADTVPADHITEQELEKIPCDNFVPNDDSVLRFKMIILDLLRQYGY